MRPVPDERSVSIHELECVSEAMDGYLQSAAEAVADHGDTITDTEGAALAVATASSASATAAAIGAFAKSVCGVEAGMT